MSQLKVNSIADASGGSNAVLYGPASPAGSMGFRNRIINGDMRIDQRNAGASVTPSSGSSYTLDRWQANASAASKFSVQQNAGSVTPPVGFTKYLGVTSLSAYSVGSADYFNVAQKLEGFNTADFGWGTANAATVTLSFWVRSSLTGTFGGSFTNSAFNRSYPFTYTINSANTWEQKSITVAGDTTGTWNTDNSNSINVLFGLGVGSTYSGTAGAWAGTNYNSATGATSVVGTNGATFYITGVQLEVGSVATEFERRPYGTELQLCMRYFQGLTYNSSIATDGMRIVCSGNNSSNPLTGWQFIVPMRASPTLTSYGGGVAGGSYSVYDVGGGSSSQTNWSSTAASIYGVRANYTGRSGYAAYWIDCGTGSGQHGWTASAEL